MRERPDRLAGPSFVLACGEFQPHLSSSPRICRRESRRGGYRDACSIARSLRGLLNACSIPRPRATPSPDGACDRPALPADHPPPVEHRGPPAAARRPVPEQDRRADNARHRPSLAVRREQRRSRRFAISHSRAIAVWAKWRRVVGRHARQIRGELVRCDKYLSLPLGYKSDVPLLYPSIGVSVRTIGRLAVR